MLIERRLGVIRDTITEYGLNMSLHFDSKVENKVNRMTRVPKKWFGFRDPATNVEAAEVSAAFAVEESLEDATWAAHLPHYMGIDRTFYLAHQICNDLSRDQVKRELVGCEICQ